MSHLNGLRRAHPEKKKMRRTNRSDGHTKRQTMENLPHSPEALALVWRMRSVIRWSTCTETNVGDKYEAADDNKWNCVNEAREAREARKSRPEDQPCM